MTIRPPSPDREQVPPEECEEFSWKTVLADGHEIMVRFVLWQERHVVDFALTQLIRDEGRWLQVARIDTRHHKIHKHQLKRGSPDEEGIVTVIKEIPPIDPWTVIDQGYDDALTMMHDEWEENLRRWRSGRQ